MFDTVVTAGIYACWGFVALIWVAGAVRGGKQLGAARKAGRDIASPAAAVAAVIILLTPGHAWQALTVGSPWLRGVGLVVLIGATAWTVRARLTLGSMWSSGAVARPDHVLRTTGPYGVTRHPVYTGILGMLAGSALAEGLGRWLALSVVVALLLLAKTRAEERLLAEEFPAEYERYRREVPRLIPRIRPARVEQGGTAHDRSGSPQHGGGRRP
jgi:protein-S-isoprenylcysteine O-methyltransferase Ste14